MQISFEKLATEHRDADMLAQHIYGEMNRRFRGCSVGCFMHSIDPERKVDDNFGDNIHAALSDATGVPAWALHIQDYLFERLDEYQDWHVECGKAYDAFSGDWNVARHVILARIQREIIPNPTAVNERVALLHDRAASGDMPDADEWSAAESAAWRAENSAAESAERSASWSAERSASWSAAESAAKSAAESAAKSAAMSAERRAERRAAWSAAWSALKDIFLETLAAQTV